jgi:hypothetical protein
MRRTWAVASRRGAWVGVPVEELDPQRGLVIDDVQVSHLCERRERERGPGSRAGDVAANEVRFPRSGDK